MQKKKKKKKNSTTTTTTAALTALLPVLPSCIVLVSLFVHVHRRFYIPLKVFPGDGYIRYRKSSASKRKPCIFFFFFWPLSFVVPVVASNLGHSLLRNMKSLLHLSVLIFIYYIYLFYFYFFFSNFFVYLVIIFICMTLKLHHLDVRVVS